VGAKHNNGKPLKLGKYCRIVDRHRFDPDPTFYFDADPDPDPDPDPISSKTQREITNQK
jgi:hypothetical protein